MFLEREDPYITIISKGEQDEEYKEETPISLVARDMLLEYLVIRKEKCNDSQVAVFLTRSNERLSVDGLKYIFKFRSSSGITPHMLRHYTGTKLYEFGGHDLQLVKEQLGYSSADTTSNSYVARNMKATYDALNRFH